MLYEVITLAPKPELTMLDLEQVLLNNESAEKTVDEFLKNRNEAMDVRSELLRIESSISQIYPWHDRNNFV